MKKSRKIFGLIGILLVSITTSSNEVVLNTKQKLERMLSIISTQNPIKKIELIGFPKVEFPRINAQKPQEYDGPKKLDKKTLENINIYEKYKKFKYPNELPRILKHAKIVDIEPELLMAIRLAENGKDSLAYGVLSNGKRYDNDKGYRLEDKFYPYIDEKEKQLSWAASIVKKNLERFEANPRGYKDFISYLASRYAPIGVKNDPIGLNNHWEKNVRFFYKKFKNSNP